MPKASRLTLRDRLFRAQILGWSFPNTTTARAYAEVEGANVKIDIERMQNRRDRLYNSLTENGWNAVKPDGGFYMLVEVPKDLFKDESDLLESLLEERILVLPGSIMDIDGWIRLSLTASDRMADFAIEGFRRLRCKRAAANPKS
jgi:aspartate/methionine/tyrosine aminotransferase